MKIIEYMADQILEELHDAKEYAEHALKYKEEHPALASVLFDLSRQEYSHSQMLHEQAVKMIEEYRRTHGEAPEVMRMMWDREHRRQIEKAAKVKHLQEMFKE